MNGSFIDIASVLCPLIWLDNKSDFDWFGVVWECLMTVEVRVCTRWFSIKWNRSIFLRRFKEEWQWLQCACVVIMCSEECRWRCEGNFSETKQISISSTSTYQFSSSSLTHTPHITPIWFECIGLFRFTPHAPYVQSITNLTASEIHEYISLLIHMAWVASPNLETQPNSRIHYINFLSFSKKCYYLCITHTHTHTHSVTHTYKTSTHPHMHCIGSLYSSGSLYQKCWWANRKQNKIWYVRR